MNVLKSNDKFTGVRKSCLYLSKLSFICTLKNVLPERIIHESGKTALRSISHFLKRWSFKHILFFCSRNSSKSPSKFNKQKWDGVRPTVQRKWTLWFKLKLSLQFLTDLDVFFFQEKPNTKRIVELDFLKKVLSFFK